MILTSKLKIGLDSEFLLVNGEQIDEKGRQRQMSVIDKEKEIHLQSQILPLPTEPAVDNKENQKH